MPCERYEQSIIAYALGELSAGDAAECLEHIQTCARCRELYDSYACIVSSITDEPLVCPTAAESESLRRALARVDLPARHPLPKGLPGLIFGSVLAFVAVATILALQVLGRLNIAAAIWSIGPAPVVAIVMIAIFVTSFLPIAVAASRRPLNGMTFRR